MQEWSLSANWWQAVVAGIVAYLIGCINFARLISRKKHKDITTIGSGNPGTMNMSRVFGAKVGVLTFVCDAFKGGVPALIAYFLTRGLVFSGTQTAVSDVARYYCGLCVIIGHIFPVTMKFKGGKGIASTLGLFWLSLATENPWNLLFGFIFLWMIVGYIYITEWGSMGSLIGVTSFSVWQLMIFYARYQALMGSGYVLAIVAFIFVINVLTWWAHRKNIMRVFSGEERHTSVKKMLKKEKK